MTKKRSKGGGGSKWFCCFGSQQNEHPDIQIDTTTTEKLMTSPKSEATMAMPPINEWRSKFVELVVCPRLLIWCAFQYKIVQMLNFYLFSIVQRLFVAHGNVHLCLLLVFREI